MKICKETSFLCKYKHFEMYLAFDTLSKFKAHSRHLEGQTLNVAFLPNATGTYEMFS